MTDLPTRLRELAESLEGCEWNHPLMSAEVCRQAADEIGRLTAALNERENVARELQRLLWIASPVDGTWVKKTWPWLSDNAAPAAKE